MRFTKTLLAAAAISSFAMTATAGGMAMPVDDGGTVVVPAPPPSGPINSGYVVLGLLAALVAASGSF